MKSILLLSGGIDSTTLLAKLSTKYDETICLIFMYGQTLEKEIEVAIINAKNYNAKSITVNLPFDFIPANCSLLIKSGIPIPKGRSIAQIREGGTPTTYVPFRNGIFLSYAVAYGESTDIQDIYCGGNGLNSGNYWDDTIQFAEAFNNAANIGTTPQYKPNILFPFAQITKKEIVKEGLKYGVDYSKTWSCYENKTSHCGNCDSCVQRKEALGYV